MTYRFTVYVLWPDQSNEYRTDDMVSAAAICRRAYHDGAVSVALIDSERGSNRGMRRDGTVIA